MRSHRKYHSGQPKPLALPIYDQGKAWTEPPKVDLPAAQASRDDAVKAVEEHADATFNAQAYQALCRVAAAKETFIVDDVWTELARDPLIISTDDKRAMGAVMQRGRREFIINPTVEFRPSAQVKCHANPRRVWRSLVVK